MRLRRQWSLLVPVLWLVAAFLVLNIPRQQMFPDEELSYRATKGDLAYTLNFQMSVMDNQAPLWFVTFWSWQQLIGDAETTSRIFGILLALPALAITYRLGRRWFRSQWVGLFAPLLLIGNAFFYTYALDIRPYPMVMLSAALSMWAFTRWLDRPTSRRVIWYGLTIGLLLYVHYLLIFLVIVQGIYFLLTRRPHLTEFAQVVLAGVIGIGIWLPWLPTFVNQVVGLHKIELASGTARGAAGIGVSTQATTGATILALLNTATNNLIWLYAALLLLGVVLLWRSRRYWLALAWALGVPTIALGANFYVAVYADRFISYAMLGLALALAAVLVRLPQRIRLVGVAVLIGANLLTFTSSIPLRTPYRDLYHQVSTVAQAGDAVFNTPASEDDGFVQWQQQHYLAPELQGGITTDLSQAQSARRIWFMTADWFAPQVQAQFHQLEPTHPVQQVIGQCPAHNWCYLAQLMEAPPLAAAQRFGANLDFWGVDVESVTPSAITTHLWWRVQTAPSKDYSISLRLLNAQGVLMAQKDGPINHYAAQIVQTSQLEPGKIYIDWRTLDLPPNLPAGAYQLQLVVYQSWDDTRLKLPDGSDTLTLKTLPLS